MQNSKKQECPFEDDDIFFFNILQFIESTWKKLLIAGLIGVLLSLSNWFFFGSYLAQYVLLNNSNNNIYALDLVSWKVIQKSLPGLADQLINQDKVPEGQLSLYKEMSKDGWWQKNIVPSYGLSKADTKDLAGVSKELDGASNTIINFTLTTEGDSKKQSIEYALASAKFLRSSAAYLHLRSLLNNYENIVMSNPSDLQQKISSANVEITYLNERLRVAEELQKRFPIATSNVIGNQVQGAVTNDRYLPLPNQIIAINFEISQYKENIIRMQARIEEIMLINAFLEQALPLRDKTVDGQALGSQLLVIESKLREKFPKKNLNQELFFDDLHTQLIKIITRFTKGLEAGAEPVAIKKGPAKELGWGFLMGIFLMLAFLLGKKIRGN